MSDPVQVQRQRLEFLPGIAEKLAWYVYALRDPRDETVFYVGKGVGNRAYAHARSAKAPPDSTLKTKRGLIAEIHAAGEEVVVEIVRSKLPDKKTAYEVEAAVIDALRHVARSDLSVQIAGHGHASRGWSSLEALRHLAATPVEIPETMHPCVLIRPRRKYRYSNNVPHQAGQKWSGDHVAEAVSRG